MATQGLTAAEVLSAVYDSFKKYNPIKPKRLTHPPQATFMNQWDFPEGRKRVMKYPCIQWFKFRNSHWVVALGEEVHAANEFCARDLIAVPISKRTILAFRDQFVPAISAVLRRASFCRLSLLMALEDGRLAFHKSSVYAPSMFEMLDLPNFRVYESRWRDVPGPLVFPDLAFLAASRDESFEPRFRPAATLCIFESLTRLMDAYDANLELKTIEQKNPSARG